MTICISTVVPQGIVMGSESREIAASENWMKNSYNGIYGPDFQIVNNSTPKVYLLANRYGLNYSGIGWTPSWHWNQTLAELEKVAADCNDIYALAAWLATQLSKVIPPGVKYGFDLGGYKHGCPILIKCNDGRMIYPHDPGGLGYNFHTRQLMAGAHIVGVVDILSKLLAGEEIDAQNMTLQDAIEFTHLTLTIGTKYLRYFKRYQEVSGGPIKILVLTPTVCGFLEGGMSNEIRALL